MVAMTTISSLGDYSLESDSLFLSFAVGQEGRPPSAEGLENALTIYGIVSKDLKSGDERTLKMGLLKLANLCVSSDKETSKGNQQIVLQAGGHRAIVNAMTMFPQNFVIQLNGIRSLNNFSYDSSEAKYMVIAAGGIEVIVSAMKAHCLHYLVQLHGCNALLTLLAGDRENAIRVVHAGGIVTVASAMNLYRDKEDLQQDASRLLKEISQVHPEAKQELRGYVNCFVVAMENEEYGVATREAARQAMMSILLRDNA